MTQQDQRPHQHRNEVHRWHNTFAEGDHAAIRPKKLARKSNYLLYADAANSMALSCSAECPRKLFGRGETMGG
jgi:hypothetical protein